MNLNVNIKKLCNEKHPYDKTFLVAGPCSVESEEQIVKTAIELAKNDVNVLRGGVWKPRTRPGSFEGIGREALSWMKTAGKEANLPVSTEVATPEHVEEALKHGFDILWIGARTSTNPFSVQAIADALKGVDIPVMVKNPISPDIELWIGAMERLNQAGITQIIALHRGFASHRKTAYRNVPDWRIPIELKRRFPNLPIMTDPSHICGKVELLQSLSQEAMDLLFDGLMLEVHINPSVALSDAKQQLTPSEYGSLIQNLAIKKTNVDNDEILQHIENLRNDIDIVDNKVIELFSKRMHLSRQIGTYKRSNDVANFQPERWDEIIKSRTTLGVDKNLSENFILRIYQYIHEESLRHQEPDMLE